MAIIPTAVATAEAVRSGQRTAGDVLEETLTRIGRTEPRLRAFQQLTVERARAEAAALDARADLADLPLAGVPVVVKDDVAVAGVAVRKGSAATDLTPSPSDDVLVTRLREAGAVLLGTTSVPEFYASAATETLAFGATLNPWDATLTAGGSSGGTGAAIAAGFAPIGVGSDGLGSIRIPSAACGLVGIKAAPGVVPHPPAAASWFGMSQHGPLATTVEDLALTLDVLAGGTRYRDVRPPDRPLRIALSLKVPLPPARVSSEVQRAVHRTADALRGAGHTVVESDPPYPASYSATLFRRYLVSPLADAEGLDRRLLERRTRHHLALGRVVQRISPVAEGDTAPLRARIDEWFAGFDLCLMPTLMAAPLPTGALVGRSFLGAALRQSRVVQHTYLANLVGYAAASVPAAGIDGRRPVGVQLLSAPGGERLILSVAHQLELARPWPRCAPWPA